MENRDNSQLFSEFISILVKNENALRVSERAIKLIAEPFDISRLDVEFVLVDSLLSHADEHNKAVLFDSGEELNTEDVYSMSYITGENGKAVFSVYHNTKLSEWTEYDRERIADVLNVLTLAFARMRLIESVKRNALTEPMTGLPNAAGYIGHVRHLQAIGTLPLYNAFYFNLKSFGLINRRFGKDETDKIIIRYSRLLTDFAQDEECIGRLGGDNFVALIKKKRTDDFLKLIGSAETFGMIDDEKMPIVIQAVAGILNIDGEVKEPGSIIGSCSVALNVAKNIAKVPYMYVTPELNSRAFRQKQIAQIFPEALAAGEFKVFYQPKVETDGNTIVGAEALVRWLSKGKIISPGEFVPVIEEDGSICKLDFYMLESVCRDIQKWLDEGIAPVRISVNFSRKNLSHPDFADRIKETIQKFNIPKEYIEVEVTETTDEAENGLLTRFMEDMHEAHIATAIDDFGTGYSSLNILRDFPVDVLKLDKSFIDHHINSDRDNVVLANVVKMAKELNMNVITEGVESWDQVDFLKGIGNNVVQGFLFDRPMPEESFCKRLETKKYDTHR